MGSFIKKIGREISRPFEQIGDFFVPDIDIEEGPDEEDLTEELAEAEAGARQQSRAATASRRQRQQRFAGTNQLTGQSRATGAAGLGGTVTGSTEALRGG